MAWPDRKLKRLIGVAGLALGVYGVAVAPGLLKRPTEVAASQSSKDSVTVTTEKPVFYEDKSLQNVIDEIRQKCGGVLTVNVEPDSVVKVLKIEVSNPDCVAKLSKAVKVGIFP